MEPRSSTRAATFLAVGLLVGGLGLGGFLVGRQCVGPRASTALSSRSLDPADAFAAGLIATTLGAAGAALLRVRRDPLRRRRVLLALASVALTSVCLESGLRLAGFGSRELPIFRENPSGAGSYRLRPGLHVATSFRGRPVAIDINRHGMRWRDVTVEPRRDTARIAVLGDSFAFGLWSGDVEQAFPSVFEARLDPDRFEVLGFGVPGYGLLDEELLLREQVAAFAPSYVVLAVFAGNDLMDTHLGLRRATVSPEGVYAAADDVVAERVPAEYRPHPTGVGTRLWRSLRIVQALRSAWFAPATDAAASSAEAAPVESRPNAESDWFWSLREYPSFAVEAENASVAALERIHALTESMHARLVVVAIPYKEQVLAPERFGPGFDVDRPQSALRDVAGRLGVPFLDLAPGLSASRRATGRPGYWLDDGHFDDDGHRVAGELLAHFFRTEVLDGRDAQVASPRAGK